MPATYLTGSIVATKIETVASPWSVTGPTGAGLGDWIVLILEFFDSEVGPNSFTGFTAGPTAEEGLNDGRGAMLYGKFQDVGAGPYSIGFPSTAEGLAVALAIRGASQATNPLNVASTALDDAAAGTTWTCTGQTTTVNGCCIIGAGGASPNGTPRVWAITAGTTQRIESHTVSDNHVLVVGTLDQTSAGTVTTSGTNSLSETTYGLQMAFAPAAPILKRSRCLVNRSGISSMASYS